MNYIYLEIMSSKIIPPFNDIISDPMLSASTGEIFYCDPFKAEYSSRSGDRSKSPTRRNTVF